MRQTFLAAAVAAITFAVVTGGIVGVGLATVDPARAEVATGMAKVHALAALPAKPARTIAATHWDVTS